MTSRDEQVTHDDNLGDFIEAFKPAAANIAAGLILGAGTIAAGVAAIVLAISGASQAHWQLPLSAEKGWCWLEVGGAGLLGIVLIGAGIALTMFCKGLVSRRVEMYTNGFRFHSRTGCEDLLWSDVCGVQETILHERPPILKGAASLILPKIKSSSYTVFAKSEKKYHFDGNSIASIRRFGIVLLEQAAQHSLPFETIHQDSD